MGSQQQRPPGSSRPGAPPGIESFPGSSEPPAPGAVTITCVDYSPARAETRRFERVDLLLASPKPRWATGRWLNVNGLHPYAIDQLREAYGFHTLNAEDVIQLGQRPRVERHVDHLFVVARIPQRVDGHVHAKQIAFFLYEGTLLSFQERSEEDGWAMVRERLERTADFRHEDVGFLLYSLLDNSVDRLFPLVEAYGDELEAIEDVLLGNPGPQTAQTLSRLRREFVQIRRIFWPMLLMLHDLRSGGDGLLSPKTKTYLGDVQEHALQLMELVDAYRDMTGGMIDLYLNSVSYRMNEIMKLLTLISTIFIPITFLSGVWGMNFRYMPELQEPWGYPLFWALCIVSVGGLLLYFNRKGWFR